METQDFFNEMIEGAIVFLRDKGYINIPSTKESSEPNYKEMVKELKQMGKF